MTDKINIEEHSAMLNDLKSNNKMPAFQFYVDDFIIGTSDLSVTDIGAYIVLLCRQWDKFELPESTQKLANIARCSEDVIQNIIDKFPVWHDGVRRNERLEIVRMTQYGNRMKAKKAGKIGASKRWSGITMSEGPKVEPKEQTRVESPVAKTEHDAIVSGRSFYIGTQLYKCNVSKYVKDNFGSFIEQWQMKHKDMNIQQIFSLMDDKYSNGYQFNNTNHIRNSFNFCVKESTQTKKIVHKNEEKPSTSKFNFGKHD